MNSPILSIVIANFNYGRFLGDAIRSVVTQEGFDECELIVVDGGSTDDSVDVIKKDEGNISWWVSEKDKGQSDAFNKGFAHAKGKLGCWVNADDILLPGTLAAVLEHLRMHPEANWITGGVTYFDEDGNVIKKRIGGCPPMGFHWWNPMLLVGGPSSFFSLEKLREVGGFDLSYNFTMDADLWWRFVRCGMMPCHLHRYFWGFRAHSESKTAGSLFGVEKSDHRDEMTRLRQKYGGGKLKRKIGRMAIRVLRALSGSFARSYFDTMRSRGEEIVESVRAAS